MTLLLLLLLASAIGASFALRWRGPGWNEQAAQRLLALPPMVEPIGCNG